MSENRPNKVILHCSATPDYKFETSGYDRFGVKDIRNWHLARGWNDVGYHTVVRRSGKSEKGRPFDVIGAHTLGHNTNSLGVCWIGTNYPTQVQVQELLMLYFMYKKMFKINWNDWYGHHEFNRYKTCPGFSMNVWRSLLYWYDSALLKNR